MSGPSLRLGLPPASLFKFPPDNAPPALPPPARNELNPIAAPFGIDSTVYNNALHAAVPLTIGAVYATTVSFVNAYNRRHGNKGWNISKTRSFHAFVILHNVFLAIYSAITCYAMARAMYAIWPGLDGENGFVGAVDALCQIQGPRGLGNAVSYNPNANVWGVKNKTIHLSALGTPDHTDVGRLWNEGLAFWGWWFYLSKFYEVLDTFIILAKGKRSTTLQTYHHTGAMLAMWAGMRYMSPPIWMFVQVNSGIHAMMYTYYTVSALGYRVPNSIKRTLTTMQITQFLVGAAFATFHLFIFYSVPVSTPFQVAKKAKVIASAASSVISSVVNDAPATSTAAVGLGSKFLKQILLRAAGEEGLAENLGSEPRLSVKDQVPALVHTHQPADLVSYETRYRNQYEWVHCLDTTGQSFAVWLNVVYLFPLTVLFSRFFYKSYVKRTTTGARKSTIPHAIEAAAKDAARGVSNKVEKEGRKAENGIMKTEQKLEKGIARSEQAFQSRAGFEKSLAPHKAELAEIEDMKKRIEAGYKDIINESLNKGTKHASEKAENVTNGSTDKSQEVKPNGTAPKEKTDSQPNGLPSPPPSEAPTDDNSQESNQTNGNIIKNEDEKDETIETEDDEEIVEDDDDEKSTGGAGLLSTTDPRDQDETYADVVKDN